MIIRKTRPEEGKRVNTLFAIAFEQPMENGPGEKPGVTNWGAFEEDTMFSTFAVTDFTQFFDGNQVKMGGIGGVATLPSHRRKGGIRGIFQAALTDMYENGCDFSYLYPFSTAYYRKFGYENCVNRSFVTVDLGLLSPRKAETVSVLAELGINAFSALICGTSDWGDALQWMPDVTLHRENQALEGVFYRKKLWIGDYF